LTGPQVVLIEDGKIEAVVAAVPDGVEVIDLGDDVTLLPGLIDAHQHLCFDAGPTVVASLQAASDDDLAAQIRRAARTALAGGITTVRDLGDRNYITLPLRDELAWRPGISPETLAAGPEILAAGPPITTTGGHCWFFGGEVASTADLRAAVAEHADRGVDAIKIMATGGGLTEGSLPHESQFDLAALRIVVDEAHRRGLPVAAHAHAGQGIADAVEAGVDSVEHCTFMTEDGIGTDLDVLATMAERGIIVSLTFGTPPLQGPLPPQIAKRLPAMYAQLLKIRELGLTVTIGSDAGIGPPKPHDVLPYGASALVTAGYSPVDALTAITVTAARSCRVEDRKGAVRPGYDADLLAVRGDPTTDVAALLEIEAVYRAGVQVAGPSSRPPSSGIPSAPEPSPAQ
jgi:imidazolonepropionase-like amidohydrolase